MCCSCAHHTYFVIFLCLLGIFGGGMGGNYLLKREVTCQSYVSGTNNKINVVDHQGTTFVGYIEDGGSRPQLPKTCWMDIWNTVSFNNIVTVKNAGLIVLGVIVILYLISTLIFVFCCNRNKLELLKNCEYEDQPFCASYEGITFAGFACILSLIYIIAMIVYLTYAVQSSEVTCQSFTACKCNPCTNTNPCVSYKRVPDLSGVVSVDTGSSLPTELPATCWLLNDSITFYNPSDLGKYFTAIYFGIMSVYILFILFTRYLQKWLIKHKENAQVPEVGAEGTPNIGNQDVRNIESAEMEGIPNTGTSVLNIEIEKQHD